MLLCKSGIIPDSGFDYLFFGSCGQISVTKEIKYCKDPSSGWGPCSVGKVCCTRMKMGVGIAAAWLVGVVPTCNSTGKVNQDLCSRIHQWALDSRRDPFLINIEIKKHSRCQAQDFTCLCTYMSTRQTTTTKHIQYTFESPPLPQLKKKNLLILLCQCNHECAKSDMIH